MSTFTLILAPSREFPRQIYINWGDLSVSASVYPRKFQSRPVAYAIALRRQDRICLDMERRELWIASAAFDLTTAECERVRRELEPLGLSIKVSPHATALPTAAAHEATVAATLPASGDRGASPLDVCSRGALESL